MNTISAIVGPNIPSCKAYINDLRRRLHQDHNTIMMIIEGLLRGLSRRKSLQPINPVWLLMVINDIPVLHLRDQKQVNGQSRDRHIPVPLSMVKLCQSLINRGIISHHLPFRKDNQYVSFVKLDSNEKRRLRMLIGVPGGINLGRKSFYNLLVDNGVGQVMRNSLMSHGATALQWNAEHWMIPYSTHLRLANEIRLIVFSSG